MTRQRSPCAAALTERLADTAHYHRWAGTSPGLNENNPTAERLRVAVQNTEDQPRNHAPDVRRALANSRQAPGRLIRGTER